MVETRGAAHNQEFEVECSIPKLDINVRGTGRSRRAAEQTSAAKRALETAQQAIAQLGRRPRKKAAAAEPVPVDAPAPIPGGRRRRRPGLRQA